jgi:ferrochelatase
VHGAEQLTVLPLYPQYSRTTTESAFDATRAALATLAWSPELNEVRDYHLHADYIAALRESVRQHWQQHGRGEALLISFHGIPVRYTETGDPYAAQCRATAEALAQALGLAAGQWQLSFQSRVGGARWTGPYTDDALAQLAQAGKTTVDVVCPGFAADCLETLEELALRGAATFARAGGRALRYIPALNDAPAHAALLARLAAAVE